MNIGIRPLRSRVQRMAVAALVVVAIAASACTSNNEHNEENEHGTHSAVFAITSPLVKDTSTTHEYVCQIQAIQHIELRALERGYLERIYVDEGQLVRKGQPMFQIMPVIYQAEYQQAQAEARVAEIEYLNTKQLADNNVVSANELAMQKAKFDQARAHVTLTKAHLDFARISAPFSGIMDRLQVRQGSLLGEGDILAALSDNSTMWVYFNVPEAQYLDYQASLAGGGHRPVKLKLANGQIYKHTGVVTTIEADFNNETGNIAFRASFPNPERLLRHGETGNIQMQDVYKNAVIIPQMATFEVLDKKFLYVVDARGVVHARPITIRAELQHLYVIDGDISATDRILLEGIRKVKDGQKITSRYVKPEDAVKGLAVYAE